jgi:NAD(P)H-dependent flavin oxidoreductase YrpB (nitropropane dioxygenase family)
MDLMDTPIDKQTLWSQLDNIGRIESKKMGDYLQTAGIITIYKCMTIQHDMLAECLGVNIISLDGFECAHHTIPEKGM